MKEQTWERHSNPLSVWTRVFTNPLVCVPVWNRSWRQVIPVAAWFVLNPRLFPPPKDDSSWATRSVLGEQIWTSKRRADLPMSLSILSALFFLLALYSAYGRRLWKIISFGGLALMFKVWFLEHMVVCYEEYLARPWWRRLFRSWVSENNGYRQLGGQRSYSPGPLEELGLGRVASGKDYRQICVNVHRSTEARKSARRIGTDEAEC